METGRDILRAEKRKVKAKDVKIQFVDGLFQDFNVLYPEDVYKEGLLVHKKGDVKYLGKLIGPKPHLDDYCGCESFAHGNVELYISEHGVSFQCKHLIASRDLRYGGYPE